MRPNLRNPFEDPTYLEQRTSQLVYARFPLFYRPACAFPSAPCWHPPTISHNDALAHHYLAHSYQQAQAQVPLPPPVQQHQQVGQRGGPFGPAHPDYWVYHGASLRISNGNSQPTGWSFPPNGALPLHAGSRQPTSFNPSAAFASLTPPTNEQQQLSSAFRPLEPLRLARESGTSLSSFLEASTTQDDFQSEPQAELQAELQTRSPVAIADAAAPRYSVSVLCRLISKLCCFESIDEADLNLTAYEIAFLRMFVARKFKIELDGERLRREPRAARAELVDLFRSNRNKRLEEQIKMVYKRCIKYLKRNFKRKIRSISYKKYLDLAFYNHYFGEVAREESMPIERFFTPGSKSQFFKVKANFTYDFLEHTKKSPIFVADVEEYLDKNFELQFAKDNRQKIKKLCNDWKSKLEESTADPDALAEELRTNMKIKLPWTIGEMRNATLNFRSILSA